MFRQTKSDALSALIGWLPLAANSARHSRSRGTGGDRSLIVRSQAADAHRIKIEGLPGPAHCLYFETEVRNPGLKMATDLRDFIGNETDVFCLARGLLGPVQI